MSSASDVLAMWLRTATLLQPCMHDMLRREDGNYLEINDLGAGVGQYGHALRRRDPRHRMRGYDGAGNVEERTSGAVTWFDLTLPTLQLPVADWVMSLEVGEHVPKEHEGTLIRNLHAHNRCGIILSWAHLGARGNAHVNTHSEGYLATIFEELGYRRSDAWTALARGKQRTTGCALGNPWRLGGGGFVQPGAFVPSNLTLAWGWLRKVTVYERWQQPERCFSSHRQRHQDMDARGSTG